MKSRLWLLLVSFLLFVATSPGWARNWTDRTGKFSTEAELVEIQGVNVILEKTNGQRIMVPIARLSEVDRQYLWSLGKPAPKQSAQPGTSDGNKSNVLDKLPDEMTNSIGMKLKLIPAGEFQRGDELQRVTLTRPF